MIERFAQFPSALAQRTRRVMFGTVPALIAHPDWTTPAPYVLWLHGRTVNKELDPGRYLRWIRAGIAAVAIDLPGHGERSDPSRQTHSATLDVLDEAIGDIDWTLEHLASDEYANVLDHTRAGIGGMSLGGMATLRRLCDPHTFTCAAVESTTGDLSALYLNPTWPARHPPDRVALLDASTHLESFRPIPFLVLHSEADRVVPFQVQRQFLDRLRAHYTHAGKSPELIEVRTWATTGAPDEHAGFGLVANDAKNAQVEFLKRHLSPTPPREQF